MEPITLKIILLALAAAAAVPMLTPSEAPGEQVAGIQEMRCNQVAGWEAELAKHGVQTCVK